MGLGVQDLQLDGLRRGGFWAEGSLKCCSLVLMLMVKGRLGYLGS